MTDKKITPESVAEVADRLLAEGQAVSNRAIIAILGGSHRDVGPLLTAWREARQEQTKLEQIEVPEALSKAAGDLLAGIWRDAMKAATAGHEGMRVQITALTQRLEAQAGDHADELDGMTAEMKRLEAERQGFLEDAVTAREERDRVVAEADAIKNRIILLEAQIDTGQVRLQGVTDQLADARAEIARARDELKVEREVAKAEREVAKAEAEAVRRDLTDQVAAARAETDAVRKAGEDLATRLRAELEAARHEASVARGERDAFRESLAASERRADREEARAREENARAAVAEAEVARLIEQLEARRLEKVDLPKPGV